MNKQNQKLKRSIIINNPAIIPFLNKQCEIHNQTATKKLTVNQLINEILEDYVARECTQTQLVLNKLSERIDNNDRQLSQLINLQKDTNQLLEELIDELRIE